MVVLKRPDKYLCIEQNWEHDKWHFIEAGKDESLFKNGKSEISCPCGEKARAPSRLISAQIGDPVLC